MEVPDSRVTDEQANSAPLLFLLIVIIIITIIKITSISIMLPLKSCHHCTDHNYYRHQINDDNNMEDDNNDFDLDLDFDFDLDEDAQCFE